MFLKTGNGWLIVNFLHFSKLERVNWTGPEESVSHCVMDPSYAHQAVCSWAKGAVSESVSKWEVLGAGQLIDSEIILQNRALKLSSTQD